MSGRSDLRDQVEQMLAGGPGPLPIVQAGHPVLRTPAAPYDGQLESGLLDRLVAALRETMRAAPGVGLAAPQVGLGLAIAVLEDGWPVDDAAGAARERVPFGFRVLINPRYEAAEARRVAFYEGCLSVRGWQAVTPRWRSVRVTGTDQHGRPLDEVVTGWAARIVQHETDHLAGRLYLDQAELRSLSAAGELARWAADPTPDRAARELGFPLP